MKTIGFVVACVLACGSLSRAEESKFIQTAEPLSPEAEQAALDVPAGFAIQLVAAEPDIGKPVSLAFDAAGRLWVAETHTYPIEPLADKTPRDAIRVLADFGPDGRARDNRVFADGLVMPDAVVPHARGAIIFAVPNVMNLVDDNGDGTADRRDVLYGPFDTHDMHNMANSFRRGFDGWIYGGHGIVNNSLVKSGDGRQTRLNGATFRFRPDGSRLELMGHGQANPFGFCFDDFGNVYSSDSHSLPIYELLRGGSYPAFGRPHDGLGFAPAMMQHSHGSTALAGLAILDDDLWPDDHRGTMVLGNVVTNRVNRDRITVAGSTKTAHEVADLVVSRDPWFRPVDVQLGPDGALYVADFYNRIIAHVEVPLAHPGRDRERGRIWRIVPLAADGSSRLRPMPDLTKAPPGDVVAALSHPNITVRFLALNRLADSGGDDVLAAVRAGFAKPEADPRSRAACLWILERLGRAEPGQVEAALRDPSPLVRVHALRVLCERPSLAASERAAVVAAAGDADALVRRTAADCLGRHRGTDAFAPLLALVRETPAADASLVYMARKSLRDNLLEPNAFAAVEGMHLPPADIRSIADVSRAIASPEAAAFGAKALAAGTISDTALPGLVEHVARHVADINGFIAVAETWHHENLDARARVFGEVCRGLKARGVAPGTAVGPWAERMVAGLLQSAADPAGDKRVRDARRRLAMEFAVECRVAQAVPTLHALAADAATDPATRLAALRAALVIAPAESVALAERLLGEAAWSPEQRGEIGAMLAGVDAPAAQALAADMIRTASGPIRARIAGVLAGSKSGGDVLLARIEAGKAAADLLLDAGIKQKLATVLPGDPRIAALAATAKPADGRLEALIKARAAAYRKTGGDVGRGLAVFTAKCSACHNADTQGDKLAPGLGGVGQRGVDRLCEDTIAPNRNVDKTFRMSVIALEDGRVLSGLLRLEEGEQLVFSDQAGKEFSVARSEIESRTETPLSLMPEGFGETLSPAEFSDLLAYLIGRPGSAN